MLFFEIYITKILENTTLDAPSKIAKHMGVPRQRVNSFKHKEFRPTADECLCVSEILGITFEEVYFTICLDKAKNNKEAEIFNRMIEKYKQDVNIPAKFKPRSATTM